MIKSFAGLAMAVALTLTGCAPMCQSPWDYCNAVIGGNGTPNCNFGARYNSSFASMNGTPPTTPVEPTPATGNGGVTDSPEAIAPPAEPSELMDRINSRLSK